MLVDTPVWVDHLRRGNTQLADLLARGAVVAPPFIIGETACGNRAERALVLELLPDLPSVAVADHGETLGFIARCRLHGKGIGVVDVHLRASVALTRGARLWTLDGRFHLVAEELGFSIQDPGTH
jgi:predicted nucleic acid-binding protein